MTDLVLGVAEISSIVPIKAVKRSGIVYITKRALGEYLRCDTEVAHLLGQMR